MSSESKIQNSVLLEKVIIEAQSGFASGERAANGVIQLRMNNVTNDGNLDWSSFIRVPATKKQVEKYLVRIGDILFNSTNSPKLVGKTTIFTCKNESVVFSNHFIRLRVDETKVNPNYLARWFTVQWQNRVFENLSTQWVNQASVRKEDLFALKIPLPPLPEQRRIAALLAKADRLRRLRRYARQLGDTYLQSVFLEMFGESLEGKTDIPLVVLEGVCTKITDGTHITPEYIESGVPFVSIKDLTKTPGQIDFSDVKYISREEHEKISRLSSVERNDILYTKVGSYGIAQIVDTDREFSIFVSVALLKPDNTKILPKFLEIVLKSDFVKRQADRLVSGIGVPDLHLREIKTFRIPLPSKPVQQIFVEVARRYDRLRKQQRESARQAEMLFQSLLKSAFEGNI